MLSRGCKSTFLARLSVLVKDGLLSENRRSKLTKGGDDSKWAFHLAPDCNQPGMFSQTETQLTIIETSVLHIHTDQIGHD